MRRIARSSKPATVAVQPVASSRRNPFTGLSTPVVRASTVVFPDAASFDARYGDFYDGYTYGLFGTPTSKALEDQLNALSGASRTLLAPSGQAALSLVFTTFLKPGEHVLLPDGVYGPVRGFASSWLAGWGVDVEFYDPCIGGGIAGLLRKATRLVLVESPCSNTMEMQDVPAIAAAAHAGGAIVAADTTWATPLHFDAFRHGVDLTIEALSKYASGHGDVLMGSLVVRDDALFRRLKDTARFLGYGVSGDDCALTLRGLATLPLRLRQSAASAEALMASLADHPCVARVLHPSRLDQPGHAIWKRDFAGASGVFSIILEPTDRARLVEAFKAFRVFRIGASWGGVASLVAPSDPRSSRSTLGWLPAGQLVRLSIGLEDIDDLKDDLERFFASLGAKHTATRAAE